MVGVAIASSRGGHQCEGRLPLTWLTLIRVHVDSLAPHESLHLLEDLELREVLTPDLPDFSKLTSLQNLQLGLMPVESLEQFSHAPNLESLWLEAIDIENLEGLSDLPRMSDTPSFPRGCRLPPKLDCFHCAGIRIRDRQSLLRPIGEFGKICHHFWRGERM